MQKLKSKRILSLSVVVLTVFLLASAFIVVKDYLRESHLDRIQEQAIAELERYDGQYDTQSIVLQNTNSGTAKLLAEKFGAKLRITSGGTFATLTLPEGMTVADVYRNDENRELLEKFSLDLYASISDTEEEKGEIHPAIAPKYVASDALYSYQSYLNYLHMENVWEQYKGDSITVAVIDSGIDTDHPEFAGKISEYSYNATEDKIVKDYGNDWSLIEDVQGHGTSVAGVIAASMDGEGIVGIAPNVTLIVIKCECSPDGSFLRTSDLVFGLYYAIERDVDVVNMSFGSSSNVFADALRLAVDSDVICVAAAGNEGTSALTYPAADPNCIGVGALADGNWELAPYSNFGDNSDIVAPGTVYTTAIGGGYRTVDGTSFASPITAAAIALLRQQNWNMEFEDVVELLYASSYDLGGLGEDFYYGFGALDISALILEERGKVTFDMLTDELEDLEYVFIRNHTLQNLPEPERLYAVFDGWYYDVHVQDELNWYTDKFTTDLTLYANWGNEDDVVPYTYVILNDGTVEIRSYTGHRRYITIPEKIEGRVVSSIGDFAFLDQTRLRQINLPSGLVNIGLNAFANCSNLTQMAIPDGVKTIGAYTFENDARLYEVTFGTNSQLTTIGDFAFKNCGLLSFELPQNVTSVNGSAFVGCTSLLNFTVRKGNTSFTADSGVLYNRTKSMLVAYPAGKSAATFTIPEGTTTIGVCSFAYAKIKTINFTKTEFIEDSAFTGSALTKVDMPDTVVAVGKSAFAACVNLTEVKLSENLTSIEAGTFCECTALPSITIPKKVQTLKSGAFEKCFSLRSVTFEENSELVLIDTSVFVKDDLRSIEIPAGVVAIGGEAFARNYNLASVTFGENSALQTIDGGSNTAGAFYACSALKSIDLPENLTTIGAFAFEESGLTEVTIPANVSYLGVGAFASCHDLENIFVDDANTYYIDIDGVVYTPDKKEIYEYPAGRTASSYTVESTVTKIGDCAFYGVWNLTSVDLPNGLETVGEYGFYDCKNVYTYNLPVSLTYIERYAFSNNTSMQYLYIPDNVIRISNYAFAYDYNCYSINLNDTSKLSRISYAAFAYTGINSFGVPANVSTMARGAFEGCCNLCWVTFAPNSKLESISAFMFDGAENLQTITFENGSALKSIQAHGLEGMRRLRTVDFGDAKLENIDNYAFRYDESLQTLNIPDTVTDIGRYAFFDAKNLQRLDIPASVESIGRYAFYGAEQLNLYFLGELLPFGLQENWDYGIAGYYVDVAEVLTAGDWQYAKLKSGNVAIIAYTGSNSEIDLTAIDLGGDITQIGGNAFAYTNIASIVLPETLEMIQRYAFAHTDLTEITIPADVTFIGQYAFLSTPITAVTFENGSDLYKIEQYAFAYTKELRTVSIPENVTVLESYAFYESGIESIDFAESCKIEKIYPHTFASSKLISVAIPNSVNYIDDNAFRDCLSLQTVTFGTAGNLQIHANAFYNTAILTLTIPANVEYIGEYAFIGLENLSAYVVEEGNEWYKSVDGVLYSKDGSNLIAFPAGRTGNFEVPATVETIGFGAFENSKLSAVSFADGINLLTIGYRAFYNAKNLVEVSIPASVVSIDYYAFAMCGALETVNFAEDNKLTGIYEGAFYSDKALKNITLPDSIVEISDYAFYSCTSLTRLPISEHNELKGIYSYAFAYSGISGELTVPETVVDLGEYCFCGTKLTSFTIPRTNEKQLFIGIGVLQDCDKLETLDIPFPGASYMDDEIYWFGWIFGAGLPSGTAIYSPQSLKNVAMYSVSSNNSYDVEPPARYLSNLETVVLPNGLTSIGNLTFQGCSSLTSITIPDSVTNIEDWAFYGCSELRIITIPDSVTNIEDWAFCGCANLTSITIPEGVTSIGIATFRNCTSLASITIPDSVTSIGNSAFEFCTSLTSITIPDSVTSIGDYAFYYCDNLYMVHNNSDLNLTIGSEENGRIAYCARVLVDKNGNKTYRYPNSDFTYVDTPDGFRFICDNGQYTLIAYLGTEETITIPKDINKNGYSITKMCGGVHNVIIPDGVTSIYDMFRDCDSITSIMIPSSVKYISYAAFENCCNLQRVLFAEGSKCTSIDSYAFFNCSSLTSITIPDGVTYIGNDAFENCTSLTSIAIPDGVTSIGNNTFRYCSSLTSITIPENVTSIGDSAFHGCSGLTSITIPKSVSYISPSSFLGCYGLTVCIAEDNPFFMENDGVVYNKGGNAEIQFVLPGRTGHITLPNGITSIPSRAFSEQTELTGITIPDSVTYIGDSAFSDCSGLTSIIIPNSVTNIGGGAFSGCSALTSITIPESVTRIGGSAFSGCTGLTSITIPESVTSIGGWMFQGCSGLTSVAIPNSVTSIGDSAFSGCSALTSITIPDSVVEIGTQTFYGCSGLSSITIPNSVTSIGGGMFRGCSGLTSITIPNSVTSIGNGAFYHCSSLTSITIPDSVTSIGGSAFYGCYNLMSITIPNSLESIGYQAFSYSDRLFMVYNSSDLDLTIGSEENGSIAYYAKILVDKNGNKTYRDPNSDFAYVDTSDGFRFIYENGQYTLIAYLGTEETITLPKDINNNQYSIYRMCGVHNIIIPEGVTSIGDDAFYDCSTLTGVAISSSVKSIGWRAFSDCTGLTSITIPDGVTSIGGSAFSGCSALTSITIPDSVTSIGSGVCDGTAYYNDAANWDNGSLYIGKHLIKVSENAEMLVPRPGTIAVAGNAFYQCYQLRNVTVSGKQVTNVNSCTNLQTLILTELPESMLYTDIFSMQVPQTFKNIVLKSGCDVRRRNLFVYISGISIFVEDPALAVQWDHDYPGWNGGNPVYYGGEWISCEWYDADGNWIDTSYQSVNQIIRQPYVGDIVNGAKKLVFVGWDIDGDGIADCVPATSTKNIVAKAVMKEIDNICTVNFYDFDGKLIFSTDYIYGDTITLPNNPTKIGYTFNGWQSYAVDMTATESMDFYGVWTHNGTGHEYVTTTIPAHCNEQGYDKHVCSICGDEYHDNFTNAPGHSFGEWIVDEDCICTEAGSRHHVCTECTYREDEVIPAHGHDYHVISETAATCTKVGERVYECSYCHDKVTETVSEGAHNYKRKVIGQGWFNPLKEKLKNIFYTYEGDKAVYYECHDCGHIMTYDESVSLMSASAQETCDHELGAWELVISPVCAAEGVEGRYCIHCRKLMEARVVERSADHHAFGDWYNTKAPTCTKTGVERRDCEYCDQYETRDVNPLGHSFTNYVSDGNATCTEDGTKTAHCDRAGCNETDTIADVGSMLAHTPAASIRENEIPATTSAEGGYDEVVYCSVCHAELSRTHQIIPKIEGKLAFSTAAVNTAWGCTFTVDVTATQTAGEGGEATITVDPLGATIVRVVAASKKATVTVSGSKITVKVNGKVNPGEKLVTLTLKTSNELPVGATSYLAIEDTVNKATFKPLTVYEMGDVNMDGKINSRDAVMIQQYAVKMITLTPEQLVYADVFCDGKINSRDAVLIQQYAVKMAVTLGDRVMVEFKSGTSTVATRTVRKGTALTTVPTAPEGKRWSASQNSFATPVYSNITASKKFYLLAD